MDKWNHKVMAASKACKVLWLYVDLFIRRALKAGVVGLSSTYRTLNKVVLNSSHALETRYLRWVFILSIRRSRKSLFPRSRGAPRVTRVSCRRLGTQFDRPGRLLD